MRHATSNSRFLPLRVLKLPPLLQADAVLARGGTQLPGNGHCSTTIHHAPALLLFSSDSHVFYMSTEFAHQHPALLEPNTASLVISKTTFAVRGALLGCCEEKAQPNKRVELSDDASIIRHKRSTGTNPPNRRFCRPHIKQGAEAGGLGPLVLSGSPYAVGVEGRGDGRVRSVSRTRWARVKTGRCWDWAVAIYRDCPIPTTTAKSPVFVLILRNILVSQWSRI
jgi:hypothetical protein